MIYFAGHVNGQLVRFKIAEITTVINQLEYEDSPKEELLYDDTGNEAAATRRAVKEEPTKGQQ